MDRAPLHFDPELYHIFHDVPVVDTFESVDSGWLVECVSRMAELERTGNVCPLILGHLDLSKKGREDYLTPVVGLARNFRNGEIKHLGPVIFADYWIRRDKLQEIKEFCGDLIRWSADLWLRQNEIDPISLLGPTTPARRLGTLQLARDGEIPLTLSRFQGGLEMPAEEKKDPAETKSLGMEEVLAALQGISAGMSEILSKLSAPAPGAAPEGAGAGPEGAAPAGGEGEGELSDEELEKMLAELEAGQAPAGETKKPEEKPVQAMAYAGPTNTKQLSRSEQELADRIHKLESENARLQLSRELDKLSEKGIVWADDEDKRKDLDFLVALPPDLRQMQLSRIEEKYAQAPVGSEILAPVQNARNSGKRKMTPDMKQAIVAHAAKNQLNFGAACKVLYGEYPDAFIE